MSVDLAMRQVVGGRAKQRTAASTSLMGRFETEILTQPKNMELLANLSGQWVDKVRQRKPLKQIVLDMDSSVSPTAVVRSSASRNSWKRLSTTSKQATSHFPSMKLSSL